MLAAMTREEKLRIIRSIDDEAVLRTQVMIPLLRNMGTYRQVIDTHGADERGKDVVAVSESSPFGFLEYTAFILKSIPISLSTAGRDKEAVGNLVAQIRTTINSGFSCLIRKDLTVKFNRVIVVSSKTISNGARTELVKAAQDLSYANLEFVEAEDLVDLVDRFLPQFYAVKSGSLANYLGKLKETCERLDELRNISVYRGEAKRLLDVFVTPTLYRVQKRRVGEVYRTYCERATLEQLLFRRGNVIMISPAGGGKSTLIRAEIQKLISRCSRTQKPFIPILVKAIDLLPVGTDLQVALERAVSRQFGLEGFDIVELGREGSLFLFVDGLDEVADSGERQALVGRVVDFARTHNGVRVIVASRPVDELDKLEAGTFSRWNLQPFNFRQVRQFIERWFAGTGGHDRLLQALKDHELLDKLPSTPLALTLLAILFDSDTQTEVPSNLSELYEMFVSVLVGRWNLGRRVDTFFQANILEYMLQEFAYHLQEHREHSVDRRTFEEILLAAGDTLGIRVDTSRAERELLDTSIIIRNESGRVEFRHISFQEFLAAKRMIREAQNEPAAGLDEKFVDDWWSPVVYYICGLNRSNARLLIDIAAMVRQVDLVPRIKSIWNYGYLIQSSYLTPSSTREDLVAEQLVLYGNAVKALLDDLPPTAVESGVPLAIWAVSFLYNAKLYYQSRFLRGLYERVYDRLKRLSPCGFGERFALLVVAGILADLGDEDILLDVYDNVKDDPLLYLCLDFQVWHAAESSEKGRNKASNIRQLSKRIRDRLKRGRSLYSQYFRAPRRKGLEKQQPTV